MKKLKKNWDSGLSYRAKENACSFVNSEFRRRIKAHNADTDLLSHCYIHFSGEDDVYFRTDAWFVRPHDGVEEVSFKLKFIRLKASDLEEVIAWSCAFFWVNSSAIREDITKRIKRRDEEFEAKHPFVYSVKKYLKEALKVALITVPCIALAAWVSWLFGEASFLSMTPITLFATWALGFAIGHGGMFWYAHFKKKEAK